MMQLRAVVFTVFCLAICGCRADDTCDVSNDYTRSDCHPEENASEDRCSSRGCCWRSPALKAVANDGLLVNIPYCYFPKGYSGYSVVNQSDTNGGLVVYLKRDTPSGVDQDIPLLKLEVVQQSQSIARVTIRDAGKLRWEPPLPTIPPAAPSSQSQYTYSLQAQKLIIARKENNQAIFSLDLSTLIYTDTFMQSTSSLPSDVIYGLGEHKGRLRRSVNYTTLTFYNQDRAPELNARLYGYHPLYINVEKDGKANGVWLKNSNAMDIILAPAPSITYRPLGGVLDFFILLGPTPADVVQQYQELVGKPTLPPYWSLGYHLCRWGHNSTAATKKILDLNLNAGVRVDVQWNDIDYMDKFNDFTVDPVNFTGLGSFVDELHEQGRHYVLILDPGVSGSEPKGEYPPFDRGVDYNVFIKTNQDKIVYGRVWNLVSTVFPDFTHPNATAYWTEMFHLLYQQVKFDGAWIDMNEPSNMENGDTSGCPDDRQLLYTPGGERLQTKTLCFNNKQHWSTHYDVHNMHGFTEGISTNKALTSIRPNKRPFIISRSSFSGQGVYTGHWTGDVYSTWTDLKDSISGTLEFSFYGIPMVGADICGFNGDSNEDLCARWQAVGAFYPFSRNHNTIGTLAQDPASMGGKVLTATKNTYYWRYKLLPHLYTLFFLAHASGSTVARPLFFNYPEDPNTYDNDEQFLWGESLMVVPALYEGQQDINAYFPRGIWYDLQNKTATINATQAGVFKTLPADWETVHFFMKGGHSVFYQEPGNTTTDSRLNPYGVYVFLNEYNNSTGSLFIDDGESADSISSNKYQYVELFAADGNILVGTSAGRTLPNLLDQIHIYGVENKPTMVRIDRERDLPFNFDQERRLLSIYGLNIGMRFSIIEYR